MLYVTHEYEGFIDFWSGNGRRWDDNAGCLFAYVGPETTLRDCVEQWIEDFMSGGDCDTFPEDITPEDLRQAILQSFTPQGRADYESGALCEYAEELAADWPRTEDGEFDYDCYEDSPVWIILVEVIDDKS